MALALAVLLLSASAAAGMRTNIDVIDRTLNRIECEAISWEEKKEKKEHCDGMAKLKCPEECAELQEALDTKEPEKKPITVSSFCDKVTSLEDCKGFMAMKCKDKCDTLESENAATGGTPEQVEVPDQTKSTADCADMTAQRCKVSWVNKRCEDECAQLAGSEPASKAPISVSSFCDKIEVDQCEGFVLQRCASKCDELREAAGGDGVTSSPQQQTGGSIVKSTCQGLTAERCKGWLLQTCPSECAELGVQETSRDDSGVPSASVEEPSCGKLTLEQCEGYVPFGCEAKCDLLQQAAQLEAEVDEDATPRDWDSAYDELGDRKGAKRKLDEVAVSTVDCAALDPESSCSTQEREQCSQECTALDKRKKAK